MELISLLIITILKNRGGWWRCNLTFLIRSLEITSTVWKQFSLFFPFGIQSNYLFSKMQFFYNCFCLKSYGFSTSLFLCGNTFPCMPPLLLMQSPILASGNSCQMLNMRIILNAGSKIIT